jgi:perosamine synthetase
VIRLARPTLGDEELSAIEEVLGSGMLVQGERVGRFEALLSARCARRHAVAVSSGTSALELALAALGVGPGDEVLVPDLTWPSPAHAVRLRGATPVLVDVDLDEWNTTAGAFAAARTPRTRAAIVIDQFGFPARHDEIARSLDGLALVEDAACAIGVELGGRPAGSFGSIACLSFHPRKLLTTGEGGACLTDDGSLADRLRTLRNHGQARPGAFVEPGGNHRLTELQAAMGAVQMGRLDALLEARRALAVRYHEALDGLVLMQRGAETARPSYQTFGALLPEGASREERDRVIAELSTHGIEAGVLSHALHRLPSVVPALAAGPRDEIDARFPNASGIVDRGFALPLHGELEERDQDLVIGALRSILRAGT